MAKADEHKEQWVKIRFDQFFDMLPTNTLSRDKLNSQRGTYQNIHYGDVLIKYPFCLDCDKYDIPYINDDVKFNATEVKDGDVIFADTAEDDTVGKCVEVLNVGDRKIVSGLHTYFCRPKFKMAAGYLGYYLNSNHFHNQLLPYIAGSKVSSVNRTSIARTYISYPDSLSAQHRIAAILSAADKVIAQTQQLIEKYKKIKQGLMEELLKPKEGWKKVRLGECLTIGNGQDYKHLQKGEIPVYGTGGIMTYVDDYLYDGETVCIGRKGTINKPIYHTGKIWTVDTLFYTYSFVDVSPLFIYYVFLTINWERFNEATGVPSLSKETIYKIEISVPDLPEQHRIAEILSGIDRKIETEENVLEKYEKVKKGLMENLLGEYKE